MNSKGSNSPLLSFFWDLASTNPEVRETTVLKLCEYLKSAQDCFNRQSEKYQEIAEKNKLVLAKSEIIGVMDLVFCPDMSYSIKRLIRGLPSNRDGARQGFSLALLQLIREYPDLISPALVLNILDESTQVTGGMKSQEEKEMYFGKLFGFMVLIRSNALFRFYNTLAEKKFVFEYFATAIIDLIHRKSYLREWASSILCDLIAHYELHAEESLDCSSMIDLSSIENSPESLALKIKMKMITSVKIDGLTEILKQTTNSHPRAHYLWKLLIDLIKDDSDLFNIWKIVDESFFNTGSHERKYLGFLVFELLLEKVDISSIQLLFTTNFTRTLFNTISSKETFLYKATQHLISSMIEKAKANQELGYILMLALISGHEKNLDHLIRNKTIEQFFTVLDSSKMKEFVEYLIKSFETSNSLNAPVILNQLVSIAKRMGVDDSLLDQIALFMLIEIQKGNEIVVSSFSNVLNVIFNRPNRLNHLKLLVDELNYENCDEQIMKVIRKTQKHLKHKVEHQIFELLMIFGLLAFRLLDPTAAIQVLEEVNDAYSRFKKKSLDYAVLIDLLTSFLIKPSALWRKIAEVGFKGICGHLADESMQSLIEVVVNNNGLDVENEDQEDGNDSEAVKEESDLNGYDNVQLELVKKILESNPDLIQKEEEESEEELLNDDEMKEFDDKLVEIFKEKKALKQEQSSLKRNLLHFKCRVVDLIIIFVKHHPDSSLNMKLIAPFLGLFKGLSNSFKKTNVESPLFVKVKGLLNILFSTSCKAEFESESLKELISARFEELLKSKNAEYSNISIKALIYLLKNVFRQNIEMEFVVSGFERCLKNLMDEKHSRIPLTLFSLMFERFPNSELARRLVDIIIPYLEFDERKPFLTLKAWNYVLIFYRYSQTSYRSLDVLQVMLKNFETVRKDYIKAVQPLLKRLIELVGIDESFVSSVNGLGEEYKSLKEMLKRVKEYKKEEESKNEEKNEKHTKKEEFKSEVNQNDQVLKVKSEKVKSEEDGEQKTHKLKSDKGARKRKSEETKKSKKKVKE